MGLGVITSHVLLPFSVPLLDSSSTLLAAFPNRTPAPPRSRVSSFSIVPVSAVMLVPRTLPIISVSISIAPIMVISISVSPVVSRTQTPAPASTTTITTVPTKQLPPQIPPDQFHVHEITITASVTVIFFELATRGFTEVGYWGEIGDDRAAGVEPALQGL